MESSIGVGIISKSTPLWSIWNFPIITPHYFTSSSPILVRGTVLQASLQPCPTIPSQRLSILLCFFDAKGLQTQRTALTPALGSPRPLQMQVTQVWDPLRLESCRWFGSKQLALWQLPSLLWPGSTVGAHLRPCFMTWLEMKKRPHCGEELGVFLSRCKMCTGWTLRSSHPRAF